MEITKEQLLQAVPDLYTGRLEEFIASFNMWSVHYGIDTPKRVCMYLAQVFHESGSLRATTENMNYTSKRLLQVFPKYFNVGNVHLYSGRPEKIANRVYANRMGNGSEGSGDGWRYRGRGYIGITGREMYMKYSKSDLCTEDVLANPQLLSKYPDDQKASMWFWQTYKLNKWADMCDVDKATKAINGGYNGLESRKRFYEKFRKVFGV